MAENKKSFVLYADLINTFEELSDEEAGKLMKLILRYVNDKNPTTDDRLIKIVFEPIKQQLKRDLVKYEDKKKQWSEAGKKSAESRATKKTNDELVSTDSTDVDSRLTDSTVNVNDTVNDTVSVTHKYRGAVYIFLKNDFEEKNVIDTNEINYFEMVVVEMNRIWMQYKPNYSFMQETDYPALLRMAYLIGKRKNISKYNVVHAKESEILKSFDKIANFVSLTDDKFFRKLTLDGLAIPKNFQKIEEAMRTFIESDKAKALESQRVTPEDYFDK